MMSEKAQFPMSAYYEYVEQLRMRKPSLSNLYQFLSNSSLAQGSCRVISFGFIEGSKKPIETELDHDGLYSTLIDDDVDRSAGSEFDMESGFEDKTWHERGSLRGRLLLVEDLDKTTMEFLGSYLSIDPMFFAGHIHLPWRGIQAQVPEQCILPSQTKRQPFVNIHHHRTIQFDKVVPPAKKLLRRSNIDRKVVISPISKDQYVGIIQHCTSILLLQRKSHWIGLALVDRHIDGEYLYSEHKGGPLQSVSLASQMFLSGYEDFLDSPPMLQQDTKSISFPNRRGLLGDLLYYWSLQSPELFDPCGPNLHSLAQYPLRIIAAEWMKYVGIMYQAIKQFEYSTSIANIPNELDKLNSDMRSLQRWRRRSMSSEHKIKATIMFLERHRPTQLHGNEAVTLTEDFEYILGTVDTFGRRLESMLPVVTSLVSIIDSRRSFDETANISRLTVMALVFVPLAYVSSLFSMSEKLGPGGPLFWVYFAVAIPVTVAVVLIAKPITMRYRPALRCVRWRR